MQVIFFLGVEGHRDGKLPVPPARHSSTVAVQATSSEPKVYHTCSHSRASAPSSDATHASGSMEAPGGSTLKRHKMVPCEALVVMEPLGHGETGIVRAARYGTERETCFIIKLFFVGFRVLSSDQFRQRVFYFSSHVVHEHTQIERQGRAWP